MLSQAVLRKEGGDPRTGHLTKGTTRTRGWHPEEKEAQLPHKGTLLPVWVLHQREGNQRPQCVKGKGPKDAGVVAPLAAAACRGNCHYDTGGRSHASARSSSSSHTCTSGPWVSSGLQVDVYLLPKVLDENVTKLHILHSVRSSPFSTTFSRDEKFKTFPLVSAYPSCALIKWLLAESSRTDGVVAHSSLSPSPTVSLRFVWFSP